MDDPRALADNSTTADYLTALGKVQRVPRPDVEICIVKDFLTPSECAALIERIDARRRPSTIANPNGDEAFRTSETCDLNHSDAFVAEIDDKICCFADIDPKYGEPLQGQRYAVGQEFKAHNDWFTPDSEGWRQYCQESGQRSWTFMIYLNEPDAGGATRFTAIDKKFAPKTGMLVCWNNMKPDNTPNPLVIHHGMKVRKGTKYVITKWFRQLPWRFPDQ